MDGSPDVDRSLYFNQKMWGQIEKMIKYYLDEDPILPNVETFMCADESDLSHVLDNLENLEKLENLAAPGSSWAAPGSS